MDIRSERLRIRYFKTSDLESFENYRSDPEVARYQAWTKMDMAEYRKFIIQMSSMKMETLPDNTWIQLAFEELETGDHIGDCAVKLFDKKRQAEIGITLAQKYQQKGYATEGLSLLYNYLFTKMRLHRIIAIVDVDNDPSINMMEKLGMRREGHFISNFNLFGEWRSEFQYAILADEFAK
ncbi:MAG: GNAT family N-acetyltransferase [Candidatus Heimdallarchaeota archaeon]|nr:GNAT family N-acetyltransferase [Candidatus Heimdallarchaeota archaeon]